MYPGLVVFFVFCSIIACPCHAKPLALAWPTNGIPWTAELPIECFIQPTASGKATSGLFGCYRNQGHRFHAGIDVKSCQRNSKGDPLDTVCAVLPGQVAYVNHTAGRSLYGRYIVLQHSLDGWPLYTLYAHLKSIQHDIRVGQAVPQGHTLGIMGHSSSSKIPKERAHLHFEIGFMLTEYFEPWYSKQKFSTPNYHSNFNGYNFLTIDPLDFYAQSTAETWIDLPQYLRSLKTAFTIEICTAQIPSFIKRYPFLCTTANLPEKNTLSGWRISFTHFGFPKAWTPITKPRIHVLPEGYVHLLDYDAVIMRLNPGTKLLSQGKKGKMIPGKKLKRSLELLFGFSVKP